MDTNQNQNDNQGKSFSGALRVEGDEAGWENGCTNNNSLRCKILSDNTLTSDSSIDFTKISSPTNGQGLYRDDKYGDSENYYFRGGSFCAYTDYLSEKTTGAKCTAAGGTWDGTTYKCNLDLSKDTCEAKGFTSLYLATLKSLGYYDTSQKFLRKVKSIAKDKGIKLIAPFSKSEKDSLIPIAKRNKITYSDFHSCDNPRKDGSPCGECPDCLFLNEIMEIVLQEDL